MYSNTRVNKNQVIFVNIQDFFLIQYVKESSKATILAESMGMTAK